ncbi:MAG: transcription termination factor NusA [Planctomycetota bacterium]
MNGELLRLIDAIHRDKDIDKEVLFDSLEQALLTAAKRKYGSVENLRVRIDRDSGEVRAYEGDEKILPIDLGRIAAQTAKQVIIQRIREAEADVVFDEFERYRHMLVNGQVQRVEGGTIVVNLGKTEGYLPRHEQVRGENYRVGDRIRAYVVEVKKTPQKVKIILSRSHPDMIGRLFELEVPEVAEGLIVLRKLVREAGYKTKVAVESLDAKVDEIGACVGVRGTRIRNIIDEIGGEKIDIIRWNDSLEVLLMNALKPADVDSITLFPEEKRALVIVDEDQLSLAIGRKGQNVRLASKLVGWDIDIMTEEEAATQGLVLEGPEVPEVEYIEGTRGDVTTIGTTIQSGKIRSPRRIRVEKSSSTSRSSPAAPVKALARCSASSTRSLRRPLAAAVSFAGAGWRSHSARSRRSASRRARRPWLRRRRAVMPRCSQRSSRTIRRSSLCRASSSCACRSSAQASK